MRPRARSAPTTCASRTWAPRATPLRRRPAGGRSQRAHRRVPRRLGRRRAGRATSRSTSSASTPAAPRSARTTSASPTWGRGAVAPGLRPAVAASERSGDYLVAWDGDDTPPLAPGSARSSSSGSTRRAPRSARTTGASRTWAPTATGRRVERPVRRLRLPLRRVPGRLDGLEPARVGAAKGRGVRPAARRHRGRDRRQRHARVDDGRRRRPRLQRAPAAGRLRLPGQRVPARLGGRRPERARRSTTSRRSTRAASAPPPRRRRPPRSAGRWRRRRRRPPGDPRQGDALGGPAAHQPAHRPGRDPAGQRRAGLARRRRRGARRLPGCDRTGRAPLGGGHRLRRGSATLGPPAPRPVPVPPAGEGRPGHGHAHDRPGADQPAHLPGGDPPPQRAQGAPRRRPHRRRRQRTASSGRRSSSPGPRSSSPRRRPARPRARRPGSPPPRAATRAR